MIQLPDDEILDGIERCCIGTFMRCSRVVPHCTVFEGPDIVGFQMGLASPMANMILGTYLTDEDVSARVAEVLELHRAKEIPMLWWTGPSSKPPTLGETLVNLGAHSIMDTPGMAAPFTPENTTLQPIPGFELREVGPEDDELWADTCLEIFNMSPELRTVFGPPLVDRSQRKTHPMVKFLGLLDGKAVATSSYSVIDDVLGIFCVATHESARGMGIGSEMTKAPMAAGQELGCRYGVLQASPMGLSVYEKLGFTTYGSFQRYLYNPLLLDSAESEAVA